MDSHDLNQVLKHFNDKIDRIYALVPLSRLFKADQESNKVSSIIFLNGNSANKTNIYVPDLLSITEMVLEMKQMLEQMKIKLLNQKELLIVQREKCLFKFDVVSKYCQHYKDNIPSFLLKNNQIADCSSQQNMHSEMDQKLKPKERPNINVISKKKEINSKKNIKGNIPAAKQSVKSNTYSNYPRIEFITEDEFKSIPNYMRGRLTYEEINKAVELFNKTIAVKYQLMGKDFCKYTDEQLKKYNAYKDQENDETNGVFFCLEEDFRQESKLKVDVVRKVVTCFRHCKRIREIRGNPAKIIRYAVLVN